MKEGHVTIRDSMNSNVEEEHEEEHEYSKKERKARTTN
jgi:hypothetical protein